MAVLSMAEREHRASTLVGVALVKTAGGLMNSALRQVRDGWFYAGRDRIVFFADLPLGELPSPYPAPLDAVTVLWEIASLPSPKVTAPFLVPNAILDFGQGMEWVGAKKRMKAIANLIEG
jgi:hypothetical protein